MDFPYQSNVHQIRLAKLRIIGYHHDIMINYEFCFAPTGKIIYACINFLGSWHDAQVSVSLITKVVANIGDFKICVDQGFLRSGDLSINL